MLQGHNNLATSKGLPTGQVLSKKMKNPKVI
jgi:hypothetical protein